LERKIIHSFDYKVMILKKNAFFLTYCLSYNLLIVKFASFLNGLN